MIPYISTNQMIGETLFMPWDYNIYIPHHKLKNILLKIWKSLMETDWNPKTGTQYKVKGVELFVFFSAYYLPWLVSRLAIFPFSTVIFILGSWSTLVPRPILLSRMSQTNVSALRILNLQSGQVAFVRSHRLMHPQWKWWVQGRRYSSSPATYGDRQIQHSYKT